MVYIHAVEQMRSLTLNKQGFFLLGKPKKVQERMLGTLKDEEIIGMIAFLDPSQATDILQGIHDKKRREKIIEELNSDFGEKISFLFGFHPSTAGGLMDINYIEVERSVTLELVKKRMALFEKKTGKIPTVLVVEGELLWGEIPHHVFFLHNKKRTQILESHVHPLPTIHHSQSTEKVIEILKNYPQSKVVVVDDTERILGVIYSDDIVRLLQKHPSKGLYDFAGVHEEEDIHDPVSSKVRHRYKWLIINLATAYLAAWVVSLFADTLSQFVLLAAYMPIVAGMGGNAATQTLAVSVRGIALGEIELKNSFRVLMSEVGAGAINGIINGAIVAVIAVLWNHSPLLGLVTAFAMIINLIVAGFFGAFIPLIMKKLGKDPATSATIFITTATDVFGFLVFLGLATLLLV